MAERPTDAPRGDSSDDVDNSSGVPTDASDTSAAFAEEPRREASARFDVKGEQSASAEMRDAMDPANQSLAEALRLSYRVLQVGILALVVTFLFSGFQSVREGATGVKTIFGRIVGDAGGEQLAPGLQPFWPYPIGELIVFDQKSGVRLEEQFEPRRRENLATKEAQINAEDSLRDMVAGKDGFVLTADGDIAHVALNATYTVQDAVEFLERVSPDTAQKSGTAQKIVRAALMRAMVLAAGQFTLRDFIDKTDPVTAAVRERAQEILDELHTGIVVADITFIDRSPPRFVEGKFREVQAKRAEAAAVVEHAKQEVAAILTGIAGEQAQRDLTELIRQYDAALVRGDQASADSVADAIGKRFEDDDVGGTVARVVQRAKAGEATVEASLIREISRLRGLAPAFEQNPRQLTRQLWLEALRTVMTGPEVEIVSAPRGIGAFDLRILSSQQVMQSRRQADLDRRKRAADENELKYADWQFGGSQIFIGGNAGRLDNTATKGKGRDDIPSNTNSAQPARQP
ncbi:MAG: SPFH domain-containing protein [Phycisphaerae bacterium]|nr:SPFH domain-containing protein [Phycisphaerae bacterium]